MQLRGPRLFIGGSDVCVIDEPRNVLSDACYLGPLKFVSQNPGAVSS